MPGLIDTLAARAIGHEQAPGIRPLLPARFALPPDERLAEGSTHETAESVRERNSARPPGGRPPARPEGPRPSTARPAPAPVEEPGVAGRPAAPPVAPPPEPPAAVSAEAGSGTARAKPRRSAGPARSTSGSRPVEPGPAAPPAGSADAAGRAVSAGAAEPEALAMTSARVTEPAALAPTAAPARGGPGRLEAAAPGAVDAPVAEPEPVSRAFVAPLDAAPRQGTASREDGRSRDASPEPHVVVTIDRVELHALPPAPAPQAPARASLRTPGMSLDQYLAERERADR
jgi:hypothetical protein